MSDSLPDALDLWLERIERQHPVEIDMGLDRVRQVHGRLGLRRDLATAITVAGTNGKGSCVAYLESIYRAAGYQTGAYTSPHLHRFNERIRVDGQAVDDAEIVAAFHRIEAARLDVTLTYFEYATLAALVIFHNSNVDVSILEVGMGGRLDAVNVVNAAVAVITSIGLDHMGWLGDNRDAIASEKAGVFRCGQPAIIGDNDPPESIFLAATNTGARVLQIGRDFGFERDAESWSWQGCVTRFDGLPLPAFGGNEQFSNASCALAAAEQLASVLRTDARQLADGLRCATLPGRFQHIRGRRNWILDVAHNGEAAVALADVLNGFSGRTIAVIGMMDDKPVEAVGLALDSSVDQWIVVDGGHSRSFPATDLAGRLQACVQGPVHCATGIPDGLSVAAKAASPADRILVTGSFRVVGPALEYLSQHA